MSAPDATDPEANTSGASAVFAHNALDLIAMNARIARTFIRNVPSPCISVCRMSPATGQCEGCLRTIDEIRGWGMQPDARKREIWGRIEQRAGELLAQRAAAATATATGIATENPSAREPAE